MDTRKDSATTTLIKRDRGKQEERERQGRRDPLYDALVAMSMEERIATINRMAERMGV